ncbi:unnamed protein product [Dibothriocephalus latus]|uniref:Uncharacterized protein n=1 Tax=Dibothriocephalus latus TaxID=60516 RepID=A0A3P7LJ55_DIBLA|nr:unnamed protein product [Dibothriocephalus latus]
MNNKDLISRSNRCCTFLAWNPWKTNLLAQGLERGRSNREPSILIWDVVNSTGTSQSANYFFPPTGCPSAPCIPELANTNHPAEMLLNYGQRMNSVFGLDKTSNSPVAMFCNRPLCDACHNESVNSFAWLSKGSFIAGVMGKYLKVYDISGNEGWLGVLLADSTFVKVFNAQLPFSQPMEESEQSLLELRAMSLPDLTHCLHLP